MRKIVVPFLAFCFLLLSAQQTPEIFNVYINGLPVATNLNATDQFYVRQGGTSKQVPFSVLPQGTVTVTGTPTTGDCAKFASPTSVADAGGCGDVASVSVTTPTGLGVSGTPCTGVCAIILSWSGAIPNAQIPTPTASALGGIQAVTCAAGLFFNTIPTNGIPTCATPAGGGNVSTSGTITSGQCPEWNSTTTLISIPCASGGGSGDSVSIRTYGAIGDGNCHPLSGIFPNLPAAQVVYPFASDLSQCVDWAATQQAINQSYNTAPAGIFGPGSFPVSCPSGNYRLSNPIIDDIPTNGTAGSAAQWVNTTTYGNGAVVTYNGLPMMSVGSGNIGNPPTLYSGFPAQLQLGSGSSYPSGAPWANVTISNANPAVITMLQGTNVAANTPLVFFPQQYPNPATGLAPALPNGINPNQAYYVVGSSISGNTFNVSATPGGAAVGTTSAGVGHFFASGQLWQFAPVQSGNQFSQHISFIGDAGLSSDAGCTYQTIANWTSPAFVIGPGNGNLVANVTLFGQNAQPGGNGARCSAPAALGGPASPSSITGVAQVGFAVMSNGGGSSRTSFEHVGAGGFYVNDWRSYGTSGQLVDQNTWIKPFYSNACINVWMNSTQSFINTMYDPTIENGTTNVFANSQEGVTIHGGIITTNGNMAASFTISSVTATSGCGFMCVTMTIAAPDTNFLQPMCSYSAAQAFHVGAAWLNAWPLASGCGYNTFIIQTAQWGWIGMYMMDFNPFTGVAVLGIPSAWAGIYQGACCGSNLTTEIQAATTLIAVEASTMWYGNNQVDNVHVENDGVATSLSVFGTAYFGGSKHAELNNIFLNVEASLGNAVCCNTVANFATNTFSMNALAQQVMPWVNSTVGDTVLDHVNGGNNTVDMDRVTIAVTTSAYLEGRHSAGANLTQNLTSGSLQNASSPLIDFQPSGVTLNPLVNPSTKGQLSGGYYGFGGSAYGAGLWDNGTLFGPYSQFSTSSNNRSDLANTWRTIGWGQAPQWGVRPAPWSNPCILDSMLTTLQGTLPAITFVATLHDHVLLTSGGTGYNMFDTITLQGGTGTPAVVFVSGETGGVITAVTVQSGGAYTALPSGPPTAFTQASTSGTGTGATFNLGTNDQAVFVNYTTGYPLLWGGQVYRVCDYKGGTASAGAYATMFTGTGYSYFQNLTGTNVPNLKWSMDGTSPFINMSTEALELMFPGLVLTVTGTGSCSGTYTGIVLEVKPSLGYVKTVGAGVDGSSFVPALAASGTTCTGSIINMQTASGNLINPY